MTIRLNNQHRNALKKLARDIVMNDMSGYEVVKKLRHDMGLIALNQIKKDYPVEDMKVLRKYEVTGEMSACLFFAHNTSELISITFYDDAAKPTNYEMPINTFAYSGGSRRPRASQKLTEAYYKYQVEEKKFNDSLNEKLNRYFQVIDHFKTYESLVEAWPEAAKISSEFTNNLPAVISDETIAMVKADAERRLAAEKSKKK